MTNLWKNTTYNAPVGSLFDMVIAEYDISKANISILREYGAINQEQYESLYNTERQKRQYTIGCMIRDDSNIQTILNEGLEFARKRLCEELGLEDGNILHIAKDAIFVVSKMIGGIPTRNEIVITPFIKFTLRGVYSNYMRLGKTVHFYHTSDLSGNQTYRIRGMDEYAQSLHRDHFLRLILDIMYVRSFNGGDMAYKHCKKIYKDLLARKVEIECYRRFDSVSYYDILPMSEFSSFQAMYLSKDMESFINPAYNLNLMDMIGNYLLCDIITRK